MCKFKEGDKVVTSYECGHYYQKGDVATLTSSPHILDFNGQGNNFVLEAGLWHCSFYKHWMPKRNWLQRFLFEGIN